MTGLDRFHLSPVRFWAPILVFVSIATGWTIKSPAENHDAQEKGWVKTNLESLITLYRHFHSHPELSLQEKETAARFAHELKQAGAAVTVEIGRHGVVGIIRNGEGPVIMVRTDLDALPVTEQTGLSFASQVKVKDQAGVEVGVMHACGHDVHMTNAIGVARYMGANKSLWKGTLMVIGQPAEEIGAGAKAMLDDGLFERFPKPTYAIALHVDSTLAAGKVGYRAGYTLANTDSIDIIVKGRGGHGAYPHTTSDPIVQAAQLILALQTIVSREIKPTNPAVITVGSIHGGTKHNIIGSECHLQLTVRSFSDDVRSHLLKAIERKAKAMAIASDAPEPVIRFAEGTPALFNDTKLTERVLPILQRVAGEANVESSEPSMGGEDFSQYGRVGVPILMYRLGSVDARRLARAKELGQEPPSLHSPIFYPDVDEALATGIQTMSAVCLDLMPN